MSSIENKGKVIYLDNAATTKMSEEVKEAMDPYLEEKMMPVPKPIFRSGFLSPYAFPHSAAFFSIIMRILLLFPGLVISGARRSLLCSPFPLSHAVSMPVSMVIIMV